ncbi:MAG: TonB-dependent receptor, partial [Veillonella sp.]|nr:TonB-dependent receptor [Veillonella sp.]
MNKYVYAATMIGLFSVTANGYTVDVTTNHSQEATNIINITANRTALLDLDTPVSTSVITQEDIQNSGAKT